MLAAPLSAPARARMRLHVPTRVRAPTCTGDASDYLSRREPPSPDTTP
jgi:hypothetical protein